MLDLEILSPIQSSSPTHHTTKNYLLNITKRRHFQPNQSICIKISIAPPYHSMLFFLCLYFSELHFYSIHSSESQKDIESDFWNFIFYVSLIPNVVDFFQTSHITFCSYILEGRSKHPLSICSVAVGSLHLCSAIPTALASACPCPSSDCQHHRLSDHDWHFLLQCYWQTCPSCLRVSAWSDGP